VVFRAEKVTKITKKEKSPGLPAEAQSVGGGSGLVSGLGGRRP
jgi:hypothetical protein